MYNIIRIIAILFLATSCSKMDKDCGCGGSTYLTIDSMPASYSGDGYFIVKDSIAGYLHVSACDVKSDWEVSKSQQSWNYIISANVKRRCPGPNPELELPAPGGPIDIIYLRKN